MSPHRGHSLVEPPAPLDVEGEPTYTIKETLDSWCREGKLQYLIEWESYGPKERSWAPVHDVLNPLLCQEFHAHQSNHPDLRPRGRPRRNPTPRGRTSISSLSILLCCYCGFDPYFSLLLLFLASPPVCCLLIS